MTLEKNAIDFIAHIKEKVHTAQYEALKIVNQQLITLYWEMGKAIAEQLHTNWGKNIVPQLSKALQADFPKMQGFSTTNLWLMVQFYSEYHQDEKLQPLVGEISWSKHLIIMAKCKKSQERQFYILATQKFGWTKNLLIHQIENQTFEKYLLNQTNFVQTLPEKIQKQARLAIKDEYTFDFLDLADQHIESELEAGLLQNIRLFLMEMGKDFTFMGSQYPLKVGNKEYYIDLLLFHRTLQCLVVIELKIGEFEPEHKGKIEFYLSVINDTIKLPHENPAIGIIICKSKNRTIVEYALKTATLPIGVATYQTTSTLPKEYEKLLPTAKEIDKKMQDFFEK
jgi:predicted nuclease of restriction endonuclease-like (RecB) superfamily